MLREDFEKLQKEYKELNDGECVTFRVYQVVGERRGYVYPQDENVEREMVEHQEHFLVFEKSRHDCENHDEDFEQEIVKQLKVDDWDFKYGKLLTGDVVIINDRAFTIYMNDVVEIENCQLPTPKGVGLSAE